MLASGRCGRGHDPHSYILWLHPMASSTHWCILMFMRWNW